MIRAIQNLADVVFSILMMTLMHTLLVLPIVLVLQFIGAPQPVTYFFTGVASTLMWLYLEEVPYTVFDYMMTYWERLVRAR